MPLPAALAARLAKRGITPTIGQSNSNDTKKEREPKVASCCPNKYNIYHDCTTWCQVHWKIQSSPEPRYLKNMRKLLEKYPLPKNCSEQFDTGIGRYYYWDMEKNLVSWLPPSHPQAVQSESAAQLRKKLHEKKSSSEDSVQKESRKIDRIEEEKEENSREPKRRRHQKGSEALDPMDPAAYSDIPRGTWSDGLETNKGKADTTASGAVFQQRPYPSPGDVLEANKSKPNRKTK